MLCKAQSGSVIVERLNDLFTYLEKIQHHSTMTDDDPWSLAPFTSLGKDCFADVDHKDLSWEIRRIGKYIIINVYK